MILKETQMLGQAIDYIKIVNSEINKLEFTSDSRNTIYYPLFNNSFQHCLAVLVLSKKELHSSSEVLLRPIIETYLRAMWTKYCATDEKLNSLQNDQGDFPGLAKLLDKVESEVPPFQGTNFLSKQIKPLVSNLHDFTHGGIQSVAKQYSGDSLSNKRSTEDIKTKIKFVSFISYLILCEISESTGTDLEFIDKEYQKLASL